MTIDPDFSSAALGHELSYIEVNEYAPIQSVLANKTEWLKPTKNPPNFGFSQSGYWLRASVTNNTGMAQNMFIDQLEIYLLNKELRIVKQYVALQAS